MSKVIIYSRVSTDKQTLAQQERTVISWLETHHLESTHTISDEGVSGGVSYKDRNLGKTILPMLEEGDTLIVSEISRLGRSMSDINKLVNDELKPRKVRLVVVQMGIDLDCSHLTAMDEMLLFAFAFAAQLEKELIQSRTQSALNVRKDMLDRVGEFISKTGKVCTHLGNGKGADLSAAQTASAEARTQRAREKKENRILWGLLKDCKSSDYNDLAIKLNDMGITTATGMPFTYERVKSAYHNLKKLYAA